MKNSTVNIDNGLSAIGKDNIAPIGESFAHWNDPTRNRRPSVTKTVEHLNHRRTHYFVERRRDNFFKRTIVSLRWFIALVKNLRKP